MGGYNYDLRTGVERRYPIDRRQFDDPEYKGTERRGAEDRRSGKDRRMVRELEKIAIMKSLSRFI